MDIRHHFAREKSGEIKVAYKEMQFQVAEILTKALGTKRFKFLRTGMSVTVSEPRSVTDDQVTRHDGV